MMTSWINQTRHVLAITVLALALAVTGVLGPVAFDQVVGGNLITATHACGAQGTGC